MRGHRNRSPGMLAVMGKLVGLDLYHNGCLGPPGAGHSPREVLCQCNALRRAMRACAKRCRERVADALQNEPIKCGRLAGNLTAQRITTPDFLSLFVRIGQLMSDECEFLE